MRLSVPVLDSSVTCPTDAALLTAGSFLASFSSAPSLLVSPSNNSAASISRCFVPAAGAGAAKDGDLGTRTGAEESAMGGGRPVSEGVVRAIKRACCCWAKDGILMAMGCGR